MKNFEFESKHIKCRYFAIWRISGDSGVCDRGTYLFQADSLHLIKKLYEYCGDNCDDRQTYQVLFTNASMQEINALDDQITDLVYHFADMEVQ